MWLAASFGKEWIRGRPLGKEVFGRFIEHYRPLNLCLKKGNDGPDSIPEGLPDLLHIIILHLHAIADEFRRVGRHRLLLDQPVDDHPPPRVFRNRGTS